MTRTLIVFARAPRLGSVKTRLARDIGRAAALRFHRETLDRTLALRHRLPGVAAVIRATPDSATSGRGFPPGLPVLPQGRGDIGRRMKRALEAEPGDVVLIGCDIPEIAAADLREAFRRLRNHDAVFGPAVDGGFWLIGLRRGFRPHRLFRDVHWSHPATLKDTLATLPSRSRVAHVRTLNDVDDVEDYRRYRALRGGTS